jgi:DNA-binding transcriptional ArsR family regulator
MSFKPEAVRPISKPRVVDASRPRLRIEVETSEAAELLFSLSALYGDNEAETFDVGAERIAAVRAGVEPRLAELAELFIGGAGCGASLLGLVYETPAPRRVADFVAQLEATEPLELQLTLLGYYMRGHHIADPETIRRAAIGEADAVDDLVAAADRWEEKGTLVRSLLELGGDRVKEQVLELITRWNAEVFEPMLGELGPLLERAAEEARALGTTLPANDFIVRVTGGIQYTAPPEIHAVVFFPSWWFRPWVLMSEHKNVRIFNFSVGVDASGDAAVDFGDLARLYKALGDEKRLALLRLLRRGPIALGEASREVGLSKSTTHHHLAILRHAGLVLIRQDDEKSYSLRDDRAVEVDRLLAKTGT